MLDENQRRIFEALPKPGVKGRMSKISKKSTILTMEQITSLRKKKTMKITQNDLDFLSNGDPLNQRFLKILDSDLKKGSLG